METKYWAPVPIGAVKAADGADGWEVSGYAATFGNVDLVDDTIKPGAFKAWLGSGQKTRFLYSHRPEQVLGRVLELREDDKGLFVRAAISKTTLGQDVHTLLQDGALDSFSIGYIPQEVEHAEKGGVRTLVRLDLPEVSVVAMPANPQATVLAVKADADADADSDASAGADADPDETKAVWSAAYVNDLPDSAFAVISAGGEKDSEGKTTPRSLRHLPHHDSSGALDMPHLRNAMSREPQTDMSPEMHGKARAHLMRHARAEGMESAMEGDMDKAAPPLLTDLPFGEHAAALAGELAAFVARAERTLADLSDKGRAGAMTAAKRLALQDVLERCSGLDAVRSDLAKALAAAGPQTDPRLSLNPLRRRLAQTRDRLLAEGILPAPETPAAA